MKSVKVVDHRPYAKRKAELYRLLGKFGYSVPS